MKQITPSIKLITHLTLCKISSISYKSSPLSRLQSGRRSVGHSGGRPGSAGANRVAALKKENLLLLEQQQIRERQQQEREKVSGGGSRGQGINSANNQQRAGSANRLTN